METVDSPGGLLETLGLDQLFWGLGEASRGVLLVVEEGRRCLHRLKFKVHLWQRRHLYIWQLKQLLGRLLGLLGLLRLLAVLVGRLHFFAAALVRDRLRCAGRHYKRLILRVFG